MSLEGHVWWLILYIDLMGPLDFQILVQTIILDVSVRVLLDEINIGISRLGKADCSSLMWVGLVQSVKGLMRRKRLILP